MPKKAILFFAISLFIIVWLIVLSRRQSVEQEPEPTPSPAVLTEKGVIPGQTAEFELKDLFGEPKFIETVAGEKSLKYESEFPGFYDEVLVNDSGIVELVKQQEIGNGKKIANYLSNPQTEPIKKYTQEYETSVAFYIYPQDGVAFMAHDLDQTVLEMWTFKPTSIQNILSTWGSNLVNREDLETLHY